MPSLTSFLKALGNEQAMANAATPLEARRQEDWLVAGLARRLDRQAGARQTAAGDDGAGSSRTAI